MTKKKDNEADRYKIAGSNRRASTRYEIIETLEAGIVLTGPEVKSLRAGGVQLQDGFARIENEQAYLWNVHIAPYAMGSLHVVQDPTRKRKLLLHHKEILKWMGKTQIKGLTIVPLEIYFNPKGIAKIKLGLCKGKRGPDQREDIKKRTVQREMQREFAGKYKVR